MKVMISMSALTPSMYRKYVKGWDKGRYADAFKDSKGKSQYRIYIPLNTVSKNSVLVPTDIQEEITKLGWELEDYRAGIAVDKTGKRRMRIGKLLAKNPKLQKQFTEDKQRAGYRGKYVICISRHPYDIAGASTDRGWSSCMNLIDGSESEYIESEIRIGSIIAYLIEEHDLNIKRPSARVMIKPFYKKDDSDQKGKPILVAERQVYGAPVSGFSDTVQRWLDKHINHHKVEGVYAIHTKSYEDKMDTYLSGNIDDPEYVSRMFELENSNEYSFDPVDYAKRELAFSSHPRLLERLPRVLYTDVQHALESDPVYVYEFLIKHYDRVYDESPADPLVKGDTNYRLLCRSITEKAPAMFTRIDHDVKFKDSEVAYIIKVNPVSALREIPDERINIEIANKLIGTIRRKLVPTVLAKIKDQLPADPIERLKLVPHSLNVEPVITPEMVITAAEAAKSRDTWHRTLTQINADLITDEIRERIIDWMISDESLELDKIISIADHWFDDKLTEQNLPYLMKLLKHVGELGSFDLRERHILCVLINMLPSKQQAELLSNASFYNVLYAALDFDSLKISDDAMRASIEADEGVDFIRASTTSLSKMFKYPKSLLFAFEQFTQHHNYEYLFANQGLSDVGIWKEWAYKDAERTAKIMEPLLKKSGLFAKLLPVSLFARYPQIVELYEKHGYATAEVTSTNWQKIKI